MKDNYADVLIAVLNEMTRRGPSVDEEEAKQILLEVCEERGVDPRDKEFLAAFKKQLDLAYTLYEVTLQ